MHGLKQKWTALQQHWVPESQVIMKKSPRFIRILIFLSCCFKKRKEVKLAALASQLENFPGMDHGCPRPIQYPSKLERYCWW